MNRIGDRLPVREHLRPSRYRPVVTEDDVDPDLLEMFPRLVGELNLVLLETWQGEGQPRRGWDDWCWSHVPLETALAAEFWGQA